MIFASPFIRRTSNSRSAFTIFELLMVIAVMGIAVTLFIANVDNAIAGVARQTVRDVVFSAISEARLLAVTEKKRVQLSYDAETGELMLWDKQRVFSRFEFSEDDQEQLEGLKFWPVQSRLMSQSGRQHQGYELVDAPIPQMTFDPTGISSFVAIEIAYQDVSTDSIWMLIDPFSNGELEGGLD